VVQRHCEVSSPGPKLPCVYVDSHCHIDRYPHPEAVLRAAARSEVVTIAVTDTPSSFKRSSSMVRPGSLLRVAVGVHPLVASRMSEHDLNLFARLLDQTDYVGEIGLDYSIHGRPTRRRQTEIFERILAVPSIREKVLTVHSRQAEADTVRLLAEARVHAILHWYQGALKHLDAALDAGMLFSVNTSMLSTRRGQRIIAALPPERVLTETDGPHTYQSSSPRSRACGTRTLESSGIACSRTWRPCTRERRELRSRTYPAWTPAPSSTDR
jgi:TatD DNase family protein